MLRDRRSARRSVRAAASPVLAFAAAAAAFAASPDPGAVPGTLEDAIRAAAAPTGGTVGVSALHIESGKRISVEGNGRFPMMSVYKFPIALGLFSQIERGLGSLKKRLPIGPSDIRLGQSSIADQYPNGGIAVTMDTLLHGMLVQSDNTASDLILWACGGPETVSKRMADLGAKDVRVDRSEGQLALDYNGVSNAPPPTQWTKTLLRSLIDAVPEDRRRAAARAWVDDPRDTATPDAMVDLLALAFRGKAANPEHTALLLRLMRATETGPRRLKGNLPPDAVLAHRSGTAATVDGFTGAVNDVGILAMPDGSHVAIAVFLKGVTSPVPTAEESIAKIGRAVRERWPASAP